MTSKTRQRPERERERKIFRTSIRVRTWMAHWTFQHLPLFLNSNGRTFRWLKILPRSKKEISKHNLTPLNIWFNTNQELARVLLFFNCSKIVCSHCKVSILAVGFPILFGSHKDWKCKFSWVCSLNILTRVPPNAFFIICSLVNLPYFNSICYLPMIQISS